jgi:hypothetical protein
MDSTFLQDIVQHKSLEFVGSGFHASEAVHLALGELLHGAGRGLQGLERFAFRARLIAAARVVLETQERQDRPVPLNSGSAATRSSAAPKS